MPTLFHFTAHEYLASIKRDGIWRGDVPTSPGGGFNAPWLTVNNTWAEQDWKDGSTLDKAAVRLTVEVPEDDPLLVKWSVLAEQEKVTPAWYAALNDAGGGAADSWYVYRGKIPWKWVTKVETNKSVYAGTPSDRIMTES